MRKVWRKVWRCSCGVPTLNFAFSIEDEDEDEEEDEEEEEFAGHSKAKSISSSQWNAGGG